MIDEFTDSAADGPTPRSTSAWHSAFPAWVDISWHEDAVCAETDPDAFFPEKGGSTREAKAICKICPVRAECLDYALEFDERFGIYGGLSERERRRLKRMEAMSA